MDQDNQNQSIDGMKPADGSTPVSGVDGFMAPTKSNLNLDSLDTIETSVENKTPTPAVDEKEKSSKAKIWIIILAVLFVIAAAAAGYFYMQYSKTKDDLASAQKLNTTASTAKSEVDTLKQQNADLQKTVNSQTGYINSLLKVANQLKTTCGAACASIVIPPAPAGVVTPTPTPSSTATVKPTTAPTVTPKTTTP